MGNNNQTVYAGAQIPKEIHDELIVLAKQSETKVSSIIRLALKEYVSKNKKIKKAI